MKLSSIKPNPNNPRTISSDDLDKLKASIDALPKMMRLRPIVVKDGVIIGGNMRYKALTALGMKEIPDEWVADADDFTDEEVHRFIVQDNLSGGEWDFDVLANQYELDELEAWGLELPESKDVSEVEEDEAPEVSDQPPVSKLGEVYQLGRWVYCPTCKVKRRLN